jgi:pentatricopeptide repeat protein
MAQNILKTSTRACSKRATCLFESRSAPFSSRATGWFRRFLSPSEEKELYLGITSSFREKLVEQSNKSAQTYSNIIEHAILSAKPIPSKTTKTGMLSLARLEQLKIDLDTAGKAKDLDKLHQLELEMDKADLMTVTMYNRLIRAYLWSNSLELAEIVLNKFDERGLVATARSYTYLIQAHLKKDQIDEAKHLVDQMQHLSLLRLRNSFDCSVMLKFYQACGNAHAIEYLWRDMMVHVDIVKPGPGLFTQYLEYLLLLPKDSKSISQTTQEFLLHQQQQQQLNLHQYITWIKAVKVLAASSLKEDTQKAEHLLFYLIKRAPPKTSWDKAKGSIQQIVSSYLSEGQDLKALAFYYMLRKKGVPDQAFGSELMESIESVLQNLEQKNHDTHVHHNEYPTINEKLY